MGGTGGIADDEEDGKAIAFDTAGNVYIAGHTSSSDFPGLSGGADTSVSGVDGFVAKLSADLRTLYQSTLVGGSSHDEVDSIAVSAAGEVFVAGLTKSSDLPSCQPAATCFPLGRPDGQYFGASEAMVAKFSGNLQLMITATFLGGNDYDEATDLALAPSGDVYVVGYTDSNDFPGTYLGYDSEKSERDAFVVRFDSNLTTIKQSTFYGGSSSETGQAIAISPTDNSVYIAGYTGSDDLLNCPGPICVEPADSEFVSTEGFIARFSVDLTSLYSATYVGGSGQDFLFDLAVAPDPDNIYGSLVYVTGSTSSTDFPGCSNGYASRLDGARDGFVARLNTSLGAIEQATYLGGSGYDDATDIAINANGDIYVAGITPSSDFPRIQGGFDTVLQQNESFISRFSDLNKGVKYYVIPMKNGRTISFGL